MKIKPRILLLVIACLTSANTLFAQAESKSSQPNIVVIVADDISHKYLGTYGGPLPTPHLDPLAQKGVRFDDPHAVTPLCNPSRYTLLAGQYPGRNRHLLNKTPEGQPHWVLQTTSWTPNDPSIARMLNEAGYFTGYVGKWHSNFGIVAKEISLEKKLFPRDNPEDDAKLRELHAWRTEMLRDVSGFDWVSHLQVGNLGGKGNTNPATTHHNPEFQTLGALEFLDAAAERGQPFFLHLANSIPHSPDNLDSLEQDARVTHDGLLEKTTTELAGHPARDSIRQRLAEAGLNTEGPVASINAGTLVMDDQLAIVRDKLDALGLADNTILVWLGDHNIYGKGSPYVPGTQTPFIIRFPDGRYAGSAIETPVSLVDLFKTTAEWTGATLPQDHIIDGESLNPLIAGETTEHALPYQEVMWWRGIRKGPFHYVAFRPPSTVIEMMQSGEVDFVVDELRGRQQNIFATMNLPYKPAHFDPDQLYDIRVDPFERHNLAYNPAYAEKLAEMKAELAAVTETFERPFPIYEVPEFMLTPAYAELVRNRKTMAKERDRHAEGYDSERILNLNLLDPVND